MEALFSKLNVTDKTGKTVTNTMRFIFGWRLTISSIMQLWEKLHNKGYKFLLTRNLNQDCLENYFGQIRNSCGNARNSTAIQFCRAFKKTFTLKFLDQTERKNCLEDASDILLAITPDFIKASEVLKDTRVYLKPILKINTNDYKNFCTEEVVSIIVIIPKLMNIHYFVKRTHKRFGGLTVPPESFIEHIKSLECIFLVSFNKICIGNGVGCKLKKEFSKTFHMII
ncbi:hypothetical protein ABEB36_009363 [Hypothenemus hampei]|uniref:Transposable element P transposase-like RNase H C-terminal domain-containing protein n=1 Tax=Hypothenemus hampei TaxID=57062 RepID=A0ABD1EG50_HYPHA